MRTRLGERARADRHHHELLEVDAAVGVRAAVEDVHHRHRQHGAADASVERADVRVERHAGAAAFARASAIETPSSALAPRRPLFGVPSSSIIAFVDRALIAVACRRAPSRSRR